MPWSPSRIGLAERHCPKALDYSDQNVPYDRAVFEGGVAAHHVLQSVGEHQNREKRPLEPDECETVAADILRRLITDGRTYEGHKEPPLNPARAAAGMELALDYLDFYPLPLEAKFEAGLAVDADWQPVDDWRGRWFGAIVDVEYETEDFETEAAAAVIVDYKSSWQAGASELETLQRKAQACVAAAHHPDVDEIWLEVHNLRTLQIHRKSVPLEGPLLARWRRQIETVIAALDTPEHAAAPGAGCHGCPYLGVCVEAQDYFERSETILQFGTDEEKARAFAVAGAMVGKLRSELKAKCQSEPIDIGGSLVGFARQDRRKAVRDAGRLLWEKWQSRGGDVSGFVKAAKPGIGQVESVAKVLWPDRGQMDTRKRFLATVTEPDNRAVFKAWKGKEE